MVWAYCDAIDLHVTGRISAADAARQERTAREILRRLEARPGVILADEVGMGKTFVALAVAVSVQLADARGRPVVVMVPSALQEKWPKDFRLFSERCLPAEIGAKLRCVTATRPIEFLKLLDDPATRRKHIIFVTHGAMSRALFDRWAKLALIWRAIYGRWGVGELRGRLAGQLAALLDARSLKGMTEEVWAALLKERPEEWLDVFLAYGVDPEGRDCPEEADDPVPRTLLRIIDRLDLEDVYAVLQALPKRHSKHYDDHMRGRRRELQEALQAVWADALQQMKVRLPLLVLDEAHHLKNPATRLAGLFHSPESEDAAENVSRGALAGSFERMLFLTATPFQLGHAELCAVLDRFDGIRWRARTAPAMTRDGFADERARLRALLDRAQFAAVRLDEAWGKLGHEDLRSDGVRYADTETWWEAVPGAVELTPAGQRVRDAIGAAAAAMAEANRALRPWVLRHLRPRILNTGGVLRRRQLPGRTIIDETADAAGIAVHGDAILPFLLAARATICTPESRPLFAEGLASSYETFLETRRNNLPAGELDVDDASPEASPATTAEQRWYLEHLQTAVTAAIHGERAPHPKLDATVNRAVALWEAGEKVLIFCYYKVTGRVLRERISRALEARIHERAAAALGCSIEGAPEALDRLGARFFDEASPMRRACNEEVANLLRRYVGLQTGAEVERLQEVVRRFMRTPSFLARYLLREAGQLDEQSLRAAFEQADDSGLSLRAVLDRFFAFLAERCTAHERLRFIEALDSVQTGSHRAQDTAATWTEDEAQGAELATLLPNVRLVNGETRQETRQRLMLTFNTPFYPEILVASAVMSEGVDLHLNCRHVIHHDLCWNPSNLEQRTGRIDRIGAKCESAGQPVCIYMPFIAETQDEKMYRVVMDRARWFGVVMGEKFRQDVETTERLAERLPLPESAARALAFRLEAG